MSARKKINTSRVPLGSLSMETSGYEAAAFDSNVNVVHDLLESMKAVAISDPNDPNVMNETIDWEKERDQMDRYFDHQAKEQLKLLPRFTKPKGFKADVNLFAHQKDGIRWLVAQERNPHPNPFCREQTLKDGSSIYLDRFTTGRKLVEGPYLPVKGAVLADEMGLGKTVQALGVILSNPPPPPPADGAGRPRPTCTLVVCPKTVIATWQKEIEKFVKPHTLHTVLYDGTPNQRSKVIQKVLAGEVDLLLVNYDRVSKEFGTERAENGWGHPLWNLADVAFYRVILDEAQEIRNPSAKKFKGVMQIVSNGSPYRVALTGTPLINNPTDIYSLLAFVGLQPWDDERDFRTYITNAIRERRKVGLTKLRAALTYVAFRRTKNAVKDLTLPPKKVDLVRVDFPEGDHKQVHDYWFAKTKEAFENAEDDSMDSSPQNKLTMQMKLRQSCASGALVVPEGLENPSSLAPKIFALLKGIDLMAKDEKGVICSQWNSFLDLAENEMTKEGHKFVRIDGSTPLDARSSAIEALNDDPSIRFILCGLKAGGCGINLTRANVVFMMDPWWNDATEMQAVDRCHRVGQTRPVRVYRMVMKGSIEERMVTNIQEAKAKLGKGAMAHLTAEELKMAKIVTLKDLFGIGAAHINELDDEPTEWE